MCVYTCVCASLYTVEMKLLNLIWKSLLPAVQFPLASHNGIVLKEAQKEDIYSPLLFSQFLGNLRRYGTQGLREGNYSDRFYLRI